MVDAVRWGVVVVVVVVVDHCGRGRGVIQLVVAGRLLLVSAGLHDVGMKQDAKEMEKTPLQTKTAIQNEEYDIDIDRRIIHQQNDLLMVLNCCTKHDLFCMGMLHIFTICSFFAAFQYVLYYKIFGGIEQHTVPVKTLAMYYSTAR